MHKHAVLLAVIIPLLSHLLLRRPDFVAPQRPALKKGGDVVKCDSRNVLQRLIREERGVGCDEHLTIGTHTCVITCDFVCI